MQCRIYVCVCVLVRQGGQIYLCHTHCLFKRTNFMIKFALYRLFVVYKKLKGFLNHNNHTCNLSR